MVDRVTARFRIVTPMFMGGADREKAVLRAAGIKGALRFWWRALHYHTYYDEALADGAQDPAEAAVKLMRKAELDLFGSTEAQSKVLMRVRDGELGNPIRCGSRGPSRGEEWQPGHGYLGYGALRYDSGNKAYKSVREAFSPGGHFEVGFVFKRSVTDAQRNTVVTAVKALGLLGGLGARWRRGWGSVALVNLDGAEWTPDEDGAALGRRFGDLLAEVEKISHDALPPISAFSGYSRIDYLLEGTSSHQIHGHVGHQLIRYRSFGAAPDDTPEDRTDATGLPAQCNFRDDHDLYVAARDNVERLQETTRVPRRAMFGLPLQYKDRIVVEPWGRRGMKRRASPLILHVHPVTVRGNEAFAVFSTLLAARFLPDSSANNLSVRGGGLKRIRKIPYTPYWHAITNFLDGTESDDPEYELLSEDYFPHRTRLLQARHAP